MSKRYTYVKCEDCERRGTPKCRHKGERWSFSVVPGCMVKIEDAGSFLKPKPKTEANATTMRNCEYGLVLYRDRLPKFNNHGQMIFNCFDWLADGREIPKCHPTQKPVRLLKRIIEIFTDRGDVVIDPVAGSGSTLRAAAECGRRGFGFEIKKEFYDKAKKEMLGCFQPTFNLMEAMA